MDRLTALVLVRWKLELRGYLRARERGIGVALGLPFLVLLSGIGTVLAYGATTALVHGNPGTAVAVLSAVPGLPCTSAVVAP